MTPQPKPTRTDLQLAEGVTLRWVEWNPDPELNPQYRDAPPLGPGEHFGAIVSHRKPDGSYCEGIITFDVERARYAGSEPRWQVESWEPLTISPSVQCDCGWHGFIRAGRWAGA